MAAAFNPSRIMAHRRNTLKAFRALANSGINCLRERMRYAQIAGSFMPDIGRGTAASLRAANALAAGPKITDAIIQTAREAVPGDPQSRMAFDTGIQLARGRNLSHAAIDVARNQIPPETRAVFDTAVTLGKGQNLQQEAWRGIGDLLTPSPYVNHPLSFTHHALRGRNLQHAALSRDGRRMYQHLRREADFETPDEFTLPATHEEMEEIRHKLRGSRVRPRRSRPRHPKKSTHFGTPHRGERPRRPASRPRPVRQPIKVMSRHKVIHAPRHSSEFIRWVQQALNDVLGLNLIVDGIPDLATRGRHTRFPEEIQAAC